MMPARLVDSHCHLDFPDFTADQDAVVARAREAGVATLLTICTHVSKFKQVAAVAGRYDDVYCTVGVHPHNAGEELDGASVDRLVALAGQSKVVGLGETGLDFYYNHSPRAAQELCFRRHLQASRITGLPVVVHCRDAEAETITILQEEAAGAGRGLPLTGLIHCFSGGAALATAALELGFLLSVSGIITFKKAEALREVIANVPLDRLLVETDAPYLAPNPHRGRRNEPAYVRHTADVVARIKGVTPETLARHTSDNFFRLFQRAEPPCA